MKDNLETTKGFLNKALGNLPGDFALQEVRYHIRQALTKLEHTEKKRLEEIKTRKSKVVKDNGAADGGGSETLFD